MEASCVSDGRGQLGVTLLVVRPHPDDESSATGGLLAYYHARGVRTGVVICTGGEEGEIHDPTLDPVADRPRLRAIRERELRNACAILGVAELRMLGYRDSGMPGTPANQHLDAFAQADPGEAAGRLVRIMRVLRPRVIVTEPPGGGYAHPDHIMCHQVSLEAFHAVGDARAYPEAGPAWPAAKLYAIAQIDDGQWETLRPAFQAAGFDVGGRQRSRKRARGAGPETATVALDVRPYSEIQRQALLAHRTQIPPESFWRHLPAELYRRAFATAYLIRLHPPAAPGKYEQDLFDGLHSSTQWCSLNG
jgi:LmbE family N-acetylglucosaminyl deacetylase